MKRNHLRVVNGPVMCALVAAVLICFSGSSARSAGRALIDSAIEDAVEDELAKDKRIVLPELDVQTDNGVVELSGTVDNILIKERAARVARTVKGVRAVINEIIVEPSAMRHARDIRSDILDALRSNQATEAYEIEVKVEAGVVALSGAVESWQEKWLAAAVAKGIKGVREVRNSIVVHYLAERTSEEIASDIREALRWDALVDHALIDVEVSNGTVRLTGTVGSAAEKQEALKVAWVMDVDSVDASGLKVEGWARDPKLKKRKYIVESDDEIRRAVRDALDYDPRVSSDTVKVEVSIPTRSSTTPMLVTSTSMTANNIVFARVTPRRAMRRSRRI